MENLKPPVGSIKKKKIIGRGPGSGRGKTSTKGQKGQKSRKGARIRIGFEGGQTPLHRRLPKRGFCNKIFTDVYKELNVFLLNKFNEGSTIDKKEFINMGILNSEKEKIKILGNGDLKKKLEVHADKFTKQAQQKIESAGGKVVVVNK